MAKLVIKDLPDNIELDRQAMKQIVGGRRGRLNAAASRGSLVLRPRPLFR